MKQLFGGDYLKMRSFLSIAVVSSGDVCENADEKATKVNGWNYLVSSLFASSGSVYKKMKEKKKTLFRGYDQVSTPSEFALLPVFINAGHKLRQKIECNTTEYWEYYIEGVLLRELIIDQVSSVRLDDCIGTRKYNLYRVLH
jgi:hypothetical protein